MLLSEVIGLKSLEDHEKKIFLKKMNNIQESCFSNEIGEEDLQGFYTT